MTHTVRPRAHYGTTAQGHVYQGLYESFSIEQDQHFPTTCRYVERNALSAKLFDRVENWPWGSLWSWFGGDSIVKLSPWPVARLSKWIERVKASMTEKEERQFQASLKKSCPFGNEKWVEKTVKRLGLESTQRPRGRPKRLS